MYNNTTDNDILILFVGYKFRRWLFAHQIRESDAIFTLKS